MKKIGFYMMALAILFGCTKNIEYGHMLSTNDISVQMIRADSNIFIGLLNNLDVQKTIVVYSLKSTETSASLDTLVRSFENEYVLTKKTGSEYRSGMTFANCATVYIFIEDEFRKIDDSAFEDRDKIEALFRSGELKAGRYFGF